MGDNQNEEPDEDESSEEESDEDSLKYDILGRLIVSSDDECSSGEDHCYGYDWSRFDNRGGGER